LKNTRRNSALWAYLHEKGVLDKGKDEILRAKKEYRQQYLKAFKQKRKSNRKDYTITCNPKEAKLFKIKAEEYGLKIASFIKQAAIAYAGNTDVIPQINMFHNILQLLLRSESRIREIAGKDKGVWYKSDKRYDELEEIVRELRGKIEQHFKKA
jgi:uncharacterized coiled-coil DUF342 family protein